MKTNTEKTQSGDEAVARVNDRAAKILHKAGRAVHAALWAAAVYLLRVPAYFLRVSGAFGGRYRGLWMISERGNDARDNGIVFFEYLNREHKEINSVYVIENAPENDRARAVNAGKTVEKRGLRYLLMLVSADALISTHDMGYAPDMVIFHHIEKLKLFRAKRVFLQHGITSNNIPWYNADQFRVDLFCCAAGRELEFAADTLGQDKKVLKLTGFCRYDNLPLSGENNGTVLVMPTWREPESHLSDAQFVKSEYFTAWQSLISNDAFNEYLKENNLTALFYPHSEFQKFLPLFTPGCRVKLAARADYDVQKLLVGCRMLVTDYSSCFFDVSYMGKPVVFWQFDGETFFTSHYHRGYLDYNDFGTVCASLDEVAGAVKTAVRSETSDFFAHRDNLNCSRVFDAVTEVLRA